MKAGVFFVALGLLSVGALGSRVRADDRTPKLWIEGNASTTLATSWQIDSAFLGRAENNDEYERNMTGLIGYSLSSRTALLANVRGVIGKYNDIRDTHGDIVSLAQVDRKRLTIGIGIRIVLR